MKKMILLFFLFSVFGGAVADEVKNMIHNPGFESGFGKDGMPRRWRSECYGGTKAVFEKETEHSDRKNTSIKITVTEHKGGAMQFVAEGRQFEKGKMYEFSALMKGETEVPVVMQLRQGPAPYRNYASKEFTLTKEWKRYRFRQVLGEAERAGFRFVLRGTGVFWIDDVQVFEISPGNKNAAPNLVGNSSFEDGFGAGNIPKGWIEDSSWAPLKVTYVPMTVNPRSGKYALRINASDYRGGSVQLASPVKLEKGKMYEISAFLQGDLQFPAALSLRRKSAPYTEYAAKTFTVGNEWNRCTFRQVINEDADSVFMLKFQGNGRLCVDDVSVREVSASDKVYENTGKNIFSNGSFELNMEGWAMLADGWGDALHQEEHNLDVQPVIDSKVSAHGKSSLRFDSVNKVPFSLNLTSKYYFLNAGRPHTLSFYAKSQDYNSLTVSIGSGEFFTGTMVTYIQKKFKMTNQFQRFEVNIPQLPMATDDAYFISIMTSSRSSIWFDAFQLEESVTASPYREGSSLEVRLSAVQPFGLVKIGKKAEFSLAMRNAEDRVQTVQGEICGEDVFGRQRVFRKIHRVLRPREIVTERFSIEGSGFWTVAAVGNFPPSETMMQFIPEQPVSSPERSPFGAHFRLNQESMDFAKMIGFKLNRMHPPVVTRWSVAESQKGKWKFFDQTLSLAKKNGIGILGLLYATPQWASSAPASLGKNGGHNGFVAYPPTRMEDWDNYVRTVVTRYKDQIRFWEIWNEPDGGFFRVPDENNDIAKRAAGYAELAIRAYKIIKEIDPGITLVIGSGCHMPPKHWLDPVLNRKESYASCDVLSIHSYGHVSHFPMYADELRLINKERGGSKPFWHSEYGIGSPNTSYRYLFEMGGDHGKCMDDVKTILQGFVYNLVAGYQKFFYYHLNSSRRSSRRECSAFREWDGMARFSAGATAVLISLLENKKFETQVSGGKNIVAFGFSGQDQDVVVFWNGNGENSARAEFRFPVRNGKELDGTLLHFSAGKDACFVESRDYPRYLILAPGTLRSVRK